LEFECRPFASWRKHKACAMQARVQELAELWPGEYVIDNEETGERVFVRAKDERKN